MEITQAKMTDMDNSCRLLDRYGDFASEREMRGFVLDYSYVTLLSSFIGAKSMSKAKLCLICFSRERVFMC